MVTADKLLGVGIYSASEAALYARIAPNLMARWVFSTSQGSSVIEPELGDTEEKIVTFLDFVQALAIRRIRQERRIPLTKIRDAYFRARDKYGVKYPFALQSTRIGLFGPPDDPSRQEIFICLDKDEKEAQTYFQLTGKKRDNQLIGEVVRTYAQRLVFDPGTGLALRYIAYPTGGVAAEQIIMDPAIRFGEPYFKSSGYTARTLFDAYRSEGTPERAAAIYGVSKEEVELAIEYFDFLKPLVRDSERPLSVR
jgi:uncharacterized protein (DUF433 family)